MHLFKSLFFFFNDTATTEIYTLSLHDALPISFDHERWSGSRSEQPKPSLRRIVNRWARRCSDGNRDFVHVHHPRSEEHTSELQSRQYLVCRLLLEKKKNKKQK